MMKEIVLEVEESSDNEILVDTFKDKEQEE